MPFGRALLASVCILLAGYTSAMLFNLVEVGLFVMAVMGFYLLIWGES